MGSSSRQLSLDLQPMWRWHEVPSGIGRPEYYIAILPDPEIAEKASRFADNLQKEYAFPVGSRHSKLLHLSVCGIGCYEEPAEDIAAALGDAIGSIHIEPFTLVLDCLMTFKTAAKHVVLSGEERQDQFRMLHVQLAKAFRLIGFHVRRKSSFLPHMTLFYRGKDIDKRELEHPFVIKANQVFLVQSHIGEGRHDHFGPWPLRMR
jgi:2'-5' RNA ligase